MFRYALLWLRYAIVSIHRLRVWPRAPRWTTTSILLPARTGGADWSLSAAMHGAPMCFGGALHTKHSCYSDGLEPLITRTLWGETITDSIGETRAVYFGWHMSVRPRVVH